MPPGCAVSTLVCILKGWTVDINEMLCSVATKEQATGPAPLRRVNKVTHTAMTQTVTTEFTEVDLDASVLTEEEERYLMELEKDGESK